MSLTIASIPGAEGLLSEIDKIVAQGQERLGDFFVPVHTAKTATLKKPPPQDARYLCNVVLQGGGVLGLAHVGFLMGLERAGVRCAGIAGTSAGAIVATGLACARRDDLYAKVAEKLLEIVSTMPLASFVDGPRSIRRVIKHALSGHPIGTPSHWWGIATIFFRLLRSRGLNPGSAFERWLVDTFAALGIRDNNTLQDGLAKVLASLIDGDHANFPPSPKQNPTGRGFVVDVSQRPQLLRVVATALPAGLKLTFPDNLRLLEERYQQDSPAIFVRASMAIPGFFEPKILEPDPEPWREEVKSRLKGFVAPNRIHEIAVLPELQMVDGGLLSNVQVDAFETMQRVLPRGGGRLEFPTVIVTMSQWHHQRRRSHKTIVGLLDDALGLANAVRLQRDRDAWWRITLAQNPNSEIVEIDTSDFNWLNFSMGDEEAGRLFRRGLLAAHDFLKRLVDGG